MAKNKFSCKKMFSSKRGISPLIATVLLIAFAVALGAVIMNWGRTYTASIIDSTEQTSNMKVDCSLNVAFGIRKIGGEDAICYDNSTDKILISLTNTGMDLNAMKVTVLGENQITNQNFAAMLKGDTRKLSVDYDDSTVGAIEQVILIPQVNIEGSSVDEFCPDAEVVIEDIGSC